MKVLLIEDEERIASFILRGLEEEGYTVELRKDGDAGLERAVRGELDMIILDPMLPAETGSTSCESFELGAVAIRS